MQIFISYRREDTAGRAGRLFDSLSANFGARNVFQDVTAIAPGTDFGQEITAAIDRCDAVLVIIGEEWTTLAGPEGRRLDDPGDYVHREVAAALSSGVPVVPVLVGGASMPAVDDLPESLKPLVQRQAVTVRDDAWHQDVDTLTRRLRREDVVVSDRPRRWPIVVAGVAVVALAAGAAAWLLAGDDDDPDGTGGTTPGETTGCPDESDAWAPIEVADNATATAHDGDAQLEFTVLEAASDLDARRVYLAVEVRNASDADTSDVPYYNEELFHALLVDGLSLGRPQCLTTVGDPNIPPGHRAVGGIGFDVIEDPSGKPLVLELFSGDPDIAITP